MLFVTQSVGFQHGSVTRKAQQLSPAERAMTELGVASGRFRVDSTQDAAADLTRENLDAHEIVEERLAWAAVAESKSSALRPKNKLDF